ncbi:hypothetical protein M011DRAFT_187759 [Sporormia fimetaria CBS 119925]|uniref:Zn(2)-C6 fungal-type domain-containing protein n=1 Tax=Sporormia fimetaria CBS 119925 TaxID=1340428 RepID=A0A6A6VM95_9PLEO|nr:hypothetical protein M011DRAFT_187759 [Sporormia fimetaria CBS 119925]
MRACEGCRRRKIKCDAATTNAWPCAACIRLKLNCVPPTVSYDKDYNATTQTFEIDTKSLEYASPVDGHQHYQRHSISGPIPHQLQTAPSTVYTYPESAYLEPSPQNTMHYPSLPQIQVPQQQNVSYTPQQIYAESPVSGGQTAMSPVDSDGNWRGENISNLTDALGELKIDHTAIAPYIANQKKTLAEAPAQEEFEVQLPSLTSADNTVRIPPEMMPSEEQALQYFDYFFTNIHPYCPVVNKAYFYQQWQSARDSISPLMLEAIFACATVMLEPIADGNKWLALAAKHEESFKDVPRLSTMQAMLLLLKAREKSPKRGYFWRSWMTIVSLVAMGKDLELDEHYETHQMGKSCGSSIHECMTKSRVWHMLFILEVMVGGPQGRFEFSISLDSVDFETPKPNPALDAGEYVVARQFTLFMRIVKNIYQTAVIAGKLRKRSPDWGLEPNFVAHNKDYPAWLQDAPDDMQIIYPSDGSAPWIPSHYLANMHSYHYLGTIMHLKPQLHCFSGSYDGLWKQHMVTCYSAAKTMCKLQEAVLKTYGLPGLLCMQRGMSFTIYAVLTCTMLHLVAITCPDPELNNDAREFFVRHMRILETCAPVWPMLEMKQQVDNLRQAFSADITKPFELKPSFPFGSPQVAPQTSPMSNDGSYRPRLPSQQSSVEQPGQAHYHTHPITPPISTSGHESKTDSPVAQSLVMMASGQRPQPSSTGMHMQEPVQWNPQRIFDQWNVAFGTPSASASSQASPPLRPPPTGNYDVRAPQDSVAQSYQLSNVSPQPSGLPNAPQQLGSTPGYTAANGQFVTPTMWQEVVASSFPDNLKRRWDSGNASMADQTIYKRAR